MGHSGVSDLIDHGREGMLCDSRDEFVTRIAEIIRDRALRARLADAARRQLDRFSWERVIERHLEVYRLAIARRRGLGDPAGSLLPLPLASVAR